MAEVTDETHARKLAKRIAEYWRSQGYTVATGVQRVSVSTGEGTYAVTSDLIGGLPQGYRPSVRIRRES